MCHLQIIEQAIRMSTIFRKVTNGFRSEWGEIHRRSLSILVRNVHEITSLYYKIGLTV